MPQHLPEIPLGSGRNPDPGKTIREEQVEDVKSIARVRLLLPHSRHTGLGRIPNPKFVPVFTERSFEPLGVQGGFHTHASWTWKCGVEFPGFSVLVFQSVLDDLARRGIHHCNLLKARVKITSDNYHRSAPSPEPWSNHRN